LSPTPFTFTLLLRILINLFLFICRIIEWIHKIKNQYNIGEKRYEFIMININSDKVKLIELAQQNDEIEVLWLYGSYAKENAHLNSDIDLAVVFKTWQEDIVERRLTSELLAMSWQKALNLNEGQLGVLDMGMAPIPIAMSVLTTGKLLLSKNSARQLQEQQRIMSKWEIDYLYHYQNKEALYG
jgi:predicted nucleotidyltransferase